LSRFPAKLPDPTVNGGVIIIRSSNIGRIISNALFVYANNQLDYMLTKDDVTFKERVLFIRNDLIELNNPNHTPDGVLIVKNREMV